MRKTIVSYLIERLRGGRELFLLSGDLGFHNFDEIRQEFPINFINMGVAEQLMISVATGMAMQGKEVYCYSILPFISFRVFEQVRMACYNNAPIRIIGTGVGYDYDLSGTTHHGLEDIQAMTSIPGLVVLSPCDKKETKLLMERIEKVERPVYIRTSRSCEDTLYETGLYEQLEIGKPVHISEGADILIVSTGVITKTALEVAEMLKQAKGKSCDILHVHTLKPFDSKMVEEHAKGKGVVVTIEENNGGLEKLVSTACNATGTRVLSFKIPDEYCSMVGKREWMLEKAGLTSKSIYNKINELL